MSSFLPSTHARGVPRFYDRAKVQQVLTLMAGGSSTRRACEEAGVTPSRLMRWVQNDTPEGIREAYMEAQLVGVLLLADDAIDIIDDAGEDPHRLNAAKARAEIRKWKAEKIAPKIYGTKLTHDHRGDVNVTYNIKSAIPGPPGSAIDAEWEEVNPDSTEDIL